MARRDPPIGRDGPSAGRQRSLWRAEADGKRPRRPERRNRSDAARGGARLHAFAPAAPNQGAAIWRPAPRPGPPMLPCRRRCGHGAPTSHASAACRPMSCCMIPPSTASPPHGLRRSTSSATSRASATRSSSITATSCSRWCGRRTRSCWSAMRPLASPSPRSCGERVGVRGSLRRHCEPIDRPVPPHPDRKGDPTSPRKRGEVRAHASDSTRISRLIHCGRCRRIR